VSWLSFGNEKFARDRVDFHGFARATQRIVLLLPQRFFVSRGERAICARQDLFLAISVLWRGRFRDLANSATSWRISGNKIFAGEAVLARSTAYKFLRLFPCLKMYPKNYANARNMTHAW
jgi:hypothetical protein